MMERKTATGVSAQCKRFQSHKVWPRRPLGGRAYSKKQHSPKLSPTYHLSLIGIIEPFQQLNAGALATPTAPNKCQRLPRVNRHRETIQNLDIRSRRVCKFTVNKINLPLEVVLRMRRLEDMSLLDIRTQKVYLIEYSGMKICVKKEKIHIIQTATQWVTFQSDIVIHTSNPSTEEVEAGSQYVHWRPAWATQEDSVSKQTSK